MTTLTTVRVATTAETSEGRVIARHLHLAGVLAAGSIAEIALLLIKGVV